jgi:hypothetical protein
MTVNQMAHKFGDGLVSWVQRDLSNRINLFRSSQGHGNVITHWNEKEPPKRFNELATLAQ